jgi:uncharacterized protein (UPF0335 family)
MTQSNELLSGYVERFESIYRHLATYKAMEKELTAEVKGVGFDATTVKRVVKARMKSADEIQKEQEARAEKEALFEIYCASLGMLDGTPLGDAARERLAKEFKEKPQPKPAKKRGAAAGQQPEAPDDDAPAPEPAKSIGPEEIAAARDAGGQAHNSGVSVLKNPYVAGDPRRASWDEGWCAAAGSDGMEIPAAYRRTKKKPDGDEPEPGADGPGAAR